MLIRYVQIILPTKFNYRQFSGFYNMYGVICCPKCRFVTGVDLQFKTKKCIKCNYNINLKKVRVIFKTEDNNELGNLIKDTRKRVENGNLFVEP